MSYTFTCEELYAILQLCAGNQTKLGDRYKRHVEMALEQLTDDIERMVLKKFNFYFPSSEDRSRLDAFVGFKDRVKILVAKEKAEEKAKRDIKAAKDTFDEIRGMLKQAEEAMGQDQDAANAWKSLEQVKQIIGVKRKASEDETKDDSDFEIDLLPAPKRPA